MCLRCCIPKSEIEQFLIICILKGLLLDVFENILNNAVKHDFNNIVEISLKVSKIKKEELIYAKFELKDNGVGVIDACKETLFERAYNKE